MFGAAAVGCRLSAGAGPAKMAQIVDNIYYARFFYDKLSFVIRQYVMMCIKVVKIGRKITGCIKSCVGYFRNWRQLFPGEKPGCTPQSERIPTGEK